MTADQPTLLALDFDGVICDGLLEYFQTAWNAYCQIWSPPDRTPPADLAPRFYRLRPVIETGWEMPILLRALIVGIPEEKILLDWSTILQQLLAENELKAGEVGYRVDHFRDEWITNDLAGWLSLQRFYPGVIERLQELIGSATRPVIVTTKEGRFVQELLQRQGVEMPEAWIFGKENRKPKHQILRELLAASGAGCRIWFIEDRLKTLLSVKQQPDLAEVRLYLADWGYNTLAERESVAEYPPIQLLSLSQFSQDFTAWPPTDLSR
ncbi:MAG: HAD family hydrolase [Actinomycetota bacterium]